MDELPARGTQALGSDSELAATMAADAMPGAADTDPPELLDVQVHELAGALALIAVGRLGR
ncbi:MAG TPA: hypothetical protein VK680_04105 [Solirubrobacteraceae bacterium]|nr:hypothetical protein [Solirubrobacteraceae bacterium]